VTEPLWHAVDELVTPRHVKLWRDDGNGKTWTEWTTVPSLWWQLEDAAAGMGDAGGEGGHSTRYRSPGSIDCLQLFYDIRDTILDALISHQDQNTAIWLVRGEQPRMHVPEALRHLASIITAVGDDDLTNWWTGWVHSWCRQVRTVLRLSDQPQPRRIRDTRCPTCHATHVTIDQGSGPERVPAFLVEFRGAYVRAARCTACGSNWFRGDDLDALKDLLEPTRHAVNGDMTA
jgi:Zn finger protein HypA/HybF involved in hydrogenase expression